MSLMQLRAFADFEMLHWPGKPGQIHIAVWAAAEIERLMKQNDTMARLLRAMVSAQHAGPITDEMYQAWAASREYLAANGEHSPSGERHA